MHGITYLALQALQTQVALCSFCFQAVIPAPATTPSPASAQTLVKLCWRKQPNSDWIQEAALALETTL